MGTQCSENSLSKGREGKRHTNRTLREDECRGWVSAKHHTNQCQGPWATESNPKRDRNQPLVQRLHKEPVKPKRWFQPSATRAMKSSISVVINRPLRGNFLQQPLEPNVGDVCRCLNQRVSAGHCGYACSVFVLLRISLTCEIWFGVPIRNKCFKRHTSFFPVFSLENVSEVYLDFIEGLVDS